MKNEKIWMKLLLGIPLFLMVCCGGNTDTAETKPISEPKKEALSQYKSDCDASPKSFAVIEFFSNEGCHSCAESEPIINSLIKASKSKEPRPNLLILSHHVTSSHGEWNDKFGLKICDSLHTRYNKTLNSQQYTPQIIFNGELIGVPDPQFLQKNMSYFITKPATTGICFEILESNNTSIKIKYYLSGFSNNQVVSILLLESNIKSPVSGGDNAGKILEHENVVRKYVSFPVTGPSDEILINIPKNLNLKNLSIAALVQDISTFKIIAATTDKKIIL